MPFQSQAQWNKFGALLKEGKITQEVFDEWAGSSPAYHKLPKHKGDKPAAPQPRSNVSPLVMRGQKRK